MFNGFVFQVLGPLSCTFQIGILRFPQHNFALVTTDIETDLFMKLTIKGIFFSFRKKFTQGIHQQQGIFFTLLSWRPPSNSAVSQASVILIASSSLINRPGKQRMLALLC